MLKRTLQDFDEVTVSAIVLSFDASSQELGPLLEAAYCLMSRASFHIDSSRDRYLCRLVPHSTDLTGDELRASFLDLVAGANLSQQSPEPAYELPEGIAPPINP